MAASSAEGIYAQEAVKVALAKVTAARAALDEQAARFALWRSYRSVRPLCAEAVQATAQAVSLIDAAKKRRAEFDALSNGANSALDAAGLALASGRALLEVAPHPELDRMLTEIQKEHNSVNMDVNAALEKMKASAWTEDVALLTTKKKALDDALLDATETTREIRRRVTEACAPTTKDKTPLFIGPGRVRAQGGIAVAAAGLTEAAGAGFVVTLARTPVGCAVLDVTEASAPDALPTAGGVTLAAWNSGGEIAAPMLFAWAAPRVWFVGSAGKWSFDAMQASGYADACDGASCADPVIERDQVAVQCTCGKPKSADMKELTRTLRFVWDGRAVVVPPP